MASTLLPNTSAYKKAQRQYLKATKNRPPNIESEWTPFRAAEKRFKARFPPPDLSAVLDLACADEARAREIHDGYCKGNLSALETVEIPINTARKPSVKAYTIPQIPGLVVLPSFVSQDKQRELVQWALARHARHPNDTNLDTHYLLPKDGIWNAWLDARDSSANDIVIQPKAVVSEDIKPVLSGPRKLINNAPASPESYLTIATAPKPPQAPSPTVSPCPLSSLIYKLRWANVGWFYHWGTKNYDFSKGPGTIDPQLRSVCVDAVKAVNWEQVHRDSNGDWGPNGPDWDTWDETYEPDAGIVNFYQEKDTLMAHVDRSEVCATSPLVSISLGNAAVFLIGGLTRDSEPIPILLRSGDIVIMSGPACRRAYHGVPRILEGTLPPHLKTTELDEPLRPEWEPYEKYLKTTRININVRQVFPRGFDPYKNVQPSR